MENVNFQPPSGEEIERALMDLGPLLGVSIKEETPDEHPDLGALPPAANNVGTGDPNGGAGPSNTASAGGDALGKESADSLASPGAPRPAPSSARCIVCNVALSQLDGTPKLMECLHSICEPCLKAKIDEKQAGSRDFLGAERITITCPQCRLQCQPANMIDQRFVLEKMVTDQTGSAGPLSSEQQCNSCEDTEPATSYCVDCAEFICDNCVHAHQRLKITKDHTIKCKDEAVAELSAAQGSARSAHDMYCREHVQERLSLFCETCDRLTCRDCQLQHHRDHKYQFSEEMATQARASVAALLSEVSYKRVLLGSAMKVIRDRQDLIADKKKSLVHEITQTVVKLTNAINTRGKQLVLRLNEVCDSKQRTLTEKKEALEQLAAITDHCVEFVGGALTHGSDTALLHAKRQVTAHLQRIKARRADIPNPDIPVRITLALDKLPDLVRVLSSIGAIVVDGKVDGGSAVTPPGPAGPAGTVGGQGPAQGPYHPPGAPNQHNAAQHNAVVALHHAAAMHQSYVGGGVGVGVGVGVGSPQVGYLVGAAGLRPRAQTPLRHSHVTSTTHPHHLHGMSEMNLRGLLNAAGARGVRPQHNVTHSAAHAMHAYHQMMGAYSGALSTAAGGGGGTGGGTSVVGGRRSVPRAPSPAPYAPHALAKWHIPQHNTNGAIEMSSGGSGTDYKITLGRPRIQPSPVTSTNPKTPSPSLNGGVVSQELDKVCAESVQDLMATIAKLDSNGVQVVAEPSPAAPSPAPHVHSSTDDHHAPTQGKPATSAGGSGDPNEDWCAVCMDGGELMCCDKCPKVFHQYCHIPTIDKLPDETETWQCLLCVKFSPLPDEADTGGGLSPRAQRLVERITLELYCQYEPSLAFREPVPQHNAHYYAKISHPMSLDTIRMKLQPRSPVRYTHVSQFVADCRTLFRNAYIYNPSESQIYKDAKRLEEFFDAQLAKWLPEYTTWSGDGEPPHKRSRLECGPSLPQNTPNLPPPY